MLLCSGNIFSQACPEASFVIALPTEEILFSFDNPGPPCASRPASITIDGSQYDKGNCDTFSTRYVLTTGSGVIDTNSYTVTYGSSSCEYTGGTLGLDEIFSINEKTLKLFPNPVQDNKELTMSFALPMDAKVLIYDLTGKLQLNDEVNSQNSKTINVSNLATGMYLLRLVNGNTVINKKLLVNY